MSEKLKNFLNNAKSKLSSILKKKDKFPKELTKADLESEEMPDVPDTPETPELPEADMDLGEDIIDEISESLPLKEKILQLTKNQISSLTALLRKSNFQQKVNGAVGKVNWTGLFDSLFAPEVRPKINQIFFIIFIAASTYSVGKIVALGLHATPKMKKKSSKAFIGGAASRGSAYRQKIENIRSANPFRAALTSDKPTQPVKKTTKKQENKLCREASRRSSLPIKLLNTVVLQDSVKSIASVQVRNNKRFAFREGDDIKGLARIGKIDTTRINVKNLSSGNCEYIASKKKSKKRKSFKVYSPKKGKKLLGKDKSGIVSKGNKFKIKKDYRDKQMANLSLLLTQARAIPINNPDGTISYKFTEIVPGSLYTKLGMQNGDIINKINGSPIRSMNQVMRLFGKIKEIDHFELDITRNGSSQNLSYDFE